MRPLNVGCAALLMLVAGIVAACGSDNDGSQSAGADRLPTAGASPAATQPASPTSIAEAAASAAASELVGIFTAVQQRIDASEQLRAVMAEPRFDDPAWQSSAREALDKMRAANTAIARVQSPRCLPNLQSSLQSSTQPTTQVSDRIAEAIDRRDAGAITAALQSLDQSDRTIALAVASIQNVRC